MGYREYHHDPYAAPPRSKHRAVIGVLIALAVGTVFSVVFGRTSLLADVSLVATDVVQRWRLWQLITYALIHVSPWHILINAAMLWIFGKHVNARLGDRRFVILCVTAAVYGGLLQVIWNYTKIGNVSPSTPVIGASGAVMGLFAYYCWSEAESVIHLVLPPIAMKAKHLFWIFFGIDVLFAFSYSSGTAHMAHVGGAATGWAWVRYGPGIETRLAAWRARRGPALTREQKQGAKVIALEAEIRERMDGLLAKISEHGIGSLTKKEKDFLNRSSKRSTDNRAGGDSWRNA